MMPGRVSPRNLGYNRSHFTPFQSPPSLSPPMRFLIVNRLLAKKPEYRFQSARDLFAYIAI